MDEILFSILQFVLAIVAGVITRYIIPWLKTKLDSEKLNTLEVWVKATVTAAEQVFCGNLMGTEKKAYVTECLSKYLLSKGIKITEEQLNILIEAAVKELNLSAQNEKKTLSQK
jgi:LL-H family phage holin